MSRKNSPDLITLGEGIKDSCGETYWRSLEELTHHPEFEAYLHREFPEQASQWTDTTSRRHFLKLMAASIAFAGLSGCSDRPAETIVPYVEMPEDLVPGKPLYYATAAALTGCGEGMLVETHLARPTKIEGNPDHPANRGASNPFAQAAVLDLYDPDRSQAIRRNGTQISTERAFINSLAAERAQWLATSGRGMRILTAPVLSPLLAHQLERLQAMFPNLQVHVWDPVFRDFGAQGNVLAYGDDAPATTTVYHFDRADVVLSLDADFLAPGQYPVRYAQDFMERRRLKPHPDGDWQMNRLYMAETTPTLTGAKADHRRGLSTNAIVALAFDVAARLGVAVESPPELGAHNVPEVWVRQLVQDLQTFRRGDSPGGALVIAGEHLPPVVHALCQAMNRQLQSEVETTSPIPRLGALPNVSATGSESPLNSLRSLIDDMQAGTVKALFILDGNPVYDSPADYAFASAMENVPYHIHLSLYHNETSRLCTWHVHGRHFLESWGDVRTFNGAVSLTQPVVAPLYGGWSHHQLLSYLLGETDITDYDALRTFWRNRTQTDDFEAWWNQALHRGVLPESTVGAEASPAQQANLRPDFAAAVQNAATASAPPAAPHTNGHRVELLFRPDPTIWDGRFANNGWLQELPKPLTKLTWDNAAALSPAFAAEVGLKNGDLVELQLYERRLSMPVWLLPGQPHNTVTLHLGYGRAQAGRVGNGLGFNVYTLRTSQAPWHASGVLRKAGGTYPLATTVHHQLLDTTEIAHRHIVRSGTLAELNAQPDLPPFVHPTHHPWSEPAAKAATNDDRSPAEPAATGEGHAEPPSFYPEWDYNGDGPQHRFKWGMVIDQTACTGCSACVVACQAENNIPVVGKTEVARGREMHWIRIDPYYQGDPADPQGPIHQPVPCMHCEKAPCEVVCPVAATTHSEEGLNEMTYNRCVGTRYCSNNCPYKVRRFNFFDYSAPVREFPSLQLLQNPDVTVRSGGVMEKCTYCVQRLNHARIDAKTNDTPPENVQVQTACQQACPTRAITFGDLNIATAPIVAQRHHPLNYALLDELNTQPRTTYLAAVKNPREELPISQPNHNG